MRLRVGRRVLITDSLGFRTGRFLERLVFLCNMMRARCLHMHLESGRVGKCEALGRVTSGHWENHRKHGKVHGVLCMYSNSVLGIDEDGEAGIWWKSNVCLDRHATQLALLSNLATRQ